MGTFGTVIIVGSILAASVAVVVYLRVDRLYRRIGRTGYLKPPDDEPEGAETPTPSRVERQPEARISRRARR